MSAGQRLTVATAEAHRAGAEAAPVREQTDACSDMSTSPPRSLLCRRLTYALGLGFSNCQQGQQSLPLFTAKV